MTHSSRAAALALAIVCAAVSGCGSRTATVSGTVRYQGKAPPNVSVALYCADKQILHAVIESSGRFTVPNVPYGLVRVTVHTHRKVPFGMWTATPVPEMMPGEGPLRPAVARNEPPPIVIPYRYAHPEESGLALVADAPECPFDIELIP